MKILFSAFLTLCVTIASFSLLKIQGVSATIHDHSSHALANDMLVKSDAMIENRLMTIGFTIFTVLMLV